MQYLLLYFIIYFSQKYMCLYTAIQNKYSFCVALLKVVLL